MKIKDLINLLQQYDEEIIVEVFSKDQAGAYTIEGTDDEDIDSGFIYIVIE